MFICIYKKFGEKRRKKLSFFSSILPVCCMSCNKLLQVAHEEKLKWRGPHVWSCLKFEASIHSGSRRTINLKHVAKKQATYRDVGISRDISDTAWWASVAIQSCHAAHFASDSWSWRKQKQVDFEIADRHVKDWDNSVCEHASEKKKYTQRVLFIKLIQLRPALSGALGEALIASTQMNFSSEFEAFPLRP